MKKQNAFTLIELLVVIAIIAILAISITVGYSSVRDSANNAKRIEIARSIATAQELYFNANNSYTNDINDLISEGYLNTNPDDTGISPSYDGSISNCKWVDNAAGCGNNTWVLRANNTGFAVRPRLDQDRYFCCNGSGCEENTTYNCPIN